MYVTHRVDRAALRDRGKRERHRIGIAIFRVDNNRRRRRRHRRHCRHPMRRDATRRDVVVAVVVFTLFKP